MDFQEQYNNIFSQKLTLSFSHLDMGIQSPLFIYSTTLPDKYCHDKWHNDYLWLSSLNYGLTGGRCVAGGDNIGVEYGFTLVLHICIFGKDRF